jgi:hypothetical protein
MYVGLALSQMWRTREDCMTAESGLDHMPGTEGEFKSSTFNPNVSTLLIKLLTAHYRLNTGITGGRDRRAVT